MNDKQKRIIGKVLNIVEDKRLAYLAGMLDYMDITGADSEREFITELHNSCCEYGAKNDTIYSFCDECRE